MSISVDVVRVFTDQAGDLGNELGVVRSWPAGREQAIATELGFSETVFVEAVARGIATIRIFTPASELPFAGHPSVGTAWWLRGEGVHTLREKAGDVAARHDGDVTWITGRAAWAPEFELTEYPHATDIDALSPSDFATGHHYVWASTGGGIRARMFAPQMGIAEDQATGAAAVRLTAALGRDLDITQGLGCIIRTRHLGGDLVEVGGMTVFDRTLSLSLE
jgi:predicted PhzF superfamily epimerase YddE/YHI9